MPNREHRRRIQTRSLFRGNDHGPRCEAPAFRRLDVFVFVAPCASQIRDPENTRRRYIEDDGGSVRRSSCLRR